MLDFNRCRLTPFAHQMEDVQAVIDHPYYFIASEMRTGKSAIIVWAAQFLFEAGVIDRILVVAPAPVRDVWQDISLGEFAKHLWLDVPATVTEFHARVRSWKHGPDAARRLEIFVTNFEFLRPPAHLAELMPVCGPKTLLVLDESSFVKGWKAKQTKACMKLRKACGRIVMLNGTPIFHSPMDLFSQGNLLSPSILECPYVTYFKARYALQEPVLERGRPMMRYGKGVQTVAGWTNLEDLQRRFAPVTVRRLQKDCLDLPPKLDPVTLTATLTPETWKAYKQMRDELVVWLKSGQVVTSATAAVKPLRLSQITGGFLGGVEDANIDVELTNDEQVLADLGVKFEREPVIYSKGEVDRQVARLSNPSGVQDIGREKLDVLLWFIEQRLEADPNLHLVVWCRFRAEMFRACAEVQRKFPQFETALIMGGQKRDERLRALALLKPETSPEGPVCVIGIEGTGSFGLDMTAAHTCVMMSSGYSPGKVAQTLDRVYGPGQKHPIAYYNIIAVGPSGQKTIDRDVLIARAGGEDIANRTASAWVRALTEE